LAATGKEIASTGVEIMQRLWRAAGVMENFSTALVACVISDTGNRIANPTRTNGVRPCFSTHSTASDRQATNSRAAIAAAAYPLGPRRRNFHVEVRIGGQVFFGCAVGRGIHYPEIGCE